MPTLLEEAERHWIKEAQKEAFKEEINHLRKGENLPKKSPLRKFFPFLDKHGVIRVGGRLNRTSLEEDVKNPQILPKGTLSTLILRHTHLATFHLHTTTRAEVSRKYEILEGSKTFEEIRDTCRTCKLHKTLQPPPLQTAATRIATANRRCG